MIVGTGLNALRIYGGKDLTLTNNELVSFAGQDKTYILLQRVDGATVTGNDAISIGYDRVTSLHEDDNLLTPAVSDGGTGALKLWLSRHPEDAFAATSSGTAAHTTNGGAGSETFALSTGDDLVFAAGGDDTIADAGGSNFLRGEDGADSMTGGSGFDDMNGNMGDDTLAGGFGDDWVVGGKDQDTLYGQQGADIVYGNLGADRCDGGDGDDVVRGGRQDDTLTGGAGNDWLSGDRDSDVITGGAGADIFHTFGDAGLDRVTDFNAAEGDRVQIDPGTSYTVAQVGADTVISMVGGGQMVLVGVNEASLPDGWLFAA
jgi:Ca2+-binding RTX toxin-like protein